MTDAERRRRVDDVCDAALERDALERAAFVAAACGGDEALRQRSGVPAGARAGGGQLSGRRRWKKWRRRSWPTTHEPSLVGRQIGSYKILALLGAGGMGEVYRARDTKLGRDVAIKVVARRFLSIPERLARFEREAQVLATLNHPHIGAIYGLEEADGVRGLVLELVEGATLAERLARASAAGAGSTRPSRADRRRARSRPRERHHPPRSETGEHQDHARRHRQGARLRPGEGVRDGGFASRRRADPDRSRSRERVEGVIAGTAGYMSPEQARGKTVDKRTDIWAFGCVLYEMLTGRPAFRGETASDTIAAILEREPDWSALPAQTPASIRRLLHRCLEKDPKRRLRDIGDARLEIEEALGAFVPRAGQPIPSVPVADVARRARARGRDSPGGLRPARGLLVIGAATAWQLQRIGMTSGGIRWKARSRRLTDFEGAEHHAAISRDGNFVAFLSDRGGTWDAWATSSEPGRNLHNLTNGIVQELRNPATRTVGFSPDGSLVILWSRLADAGKGGTVNAGWAVPTMGGPLRPYQKGSRSVSEVDFSPDGKRMVYHPPTEGDPLFVTEADGKLGRRDPCCAAGLPQPLSGLVA